MPNTATQVENFSRTNKMRLAAGVGPASIQRPAGRSAAEPPLEQWEHKLDQEWQARLRCLEQWLSKLLVKNEQLRMSLLLATSGHGTPDPLAGENGSHARIIHIDEP